MKNPKKKKEKVVMVSGGFDPIHIGHVRYMQEAKKLGDKLVVVINNDHWLRKKKGTAFMPEIERKEIIEAISCVDQVVISSHTKNTKDMSVCEELIKVKPHVFANGGDRDEKNAQDPASSLYRDINMCKVLGVEMVFNVGHGGKVRSSSELLKEYSKKIKKQKK